jgi:hypothetical protein
VQDEHDPIEPQSVEEPVNVADVVSEPIFDVRLIRAAVPDQVRCDDTSLRREDRDHLPPEVGPGGVAVQKHQGRLVPATLVDDGHSRSQNVVEARLVWEV